MSTGLLSPSRADSRGTERGVVLILAVFAVVLLTVLAVGITAAVRVELLASRAGLDRAQALFLAEAGLNQARALLLYDDQTVDTLFDDWGPWAENPLDLPRRLGNGFYRVRVHDACARIDVNQADYFTLVRLIGDPAAAASIQDWRDGGEAPTPDGAEWPYYAELPNPYLPRDAPFQTPGELLLVRAVTPEIFFGSDQRLGLVDLVTVDSVSPNTDPAGQRRMSLNGFRSWSEEAFRNWAIQKLGPLFLMYKPDILFEGLSKLNEMGRSGYTSLAELRTVVGLDFGTIAQIIDYVSIDGGLQTDGKVNVNTAPFEVLAALPGSSSAVAQAMIAAREQEPFRLLGDVVRAMIDLPSGEAVFEQMIDHVTTKSSCFLIETMGWTSAGHTHRTLTALVRRKPDMVSVIRQAEQDWPLPPLEEGIRSIATR